MAENDVNPYQMAEDGWSELVAAAAKIQAAANLLKKGEKSIDGYNIERSLNKHKPDLMKQHLEGLRLHRKENKV
ncbi:MAG TPA: hypothetical protein VEK08_10935 [Planctomycetota bacterium]|nr:hypothetical protein [Planctomycetota bacterium]